MNYKYFLDLKSFHKFAHSGYCTFNTNGISLIDYDKIFSLYKNVSGKSFGKNYNITAICQIAIASMQLYLEFNDEKYLKEFEINVNWLFKNSRINDECAYWDYNFYFPSYRLKPPFQSGMAQGLVLSTLIYSYSYKNSQETFDLITKTFNSFLNESSSFVLNHNKQIWFEEYPSQPSSFVLNGFIFAMIGIWDYYILTNDTRAKNIFDNCVYSLKCNLKTYDMFFWSRYDRFPGRTASFEYHNLHIDQLNYLYKISNEKTFLFYAIKWQNQKSVKFYKILAKFGGLNIHVKIKTFIIAISERFIKQQ
jgi:hypothetical protein